jgi:hypothetical protein
MTRGARTRYRGEPKDRTPLPIKWAGASKFHGLFNLRPFLMARRRRPYEYVYESELADRSLGQDEGI